MKKHIIALAILLAFGTAFYTVGCGTSGGSGTTTTSTTSSTTSTTAPGSFSLTSSSFSDGGSIPNKNAMTGHGIPGAENKSVPLSWANPPGSTLYYAIKMIDANVSSAHWLVINIPHTVISLAEGASPSGINGYECPNDYTSGQYEGPWPPSGSTHTYVFTIYACSASVDSSGINNESTFDSAVSAVSLGSTTLSGTFTW